MCPSWSVLGAYEAGRCSETMCLVLVAEGSGAPSMLVSPGALTPFPACSCLPVSARATNSVRHSVVLGEMSCPWATIYTSSATCAHTEG